MGSLQFGPRKSAQFSMAAISFVTACKKLKIAQIVQINQLFQLLNLICVCGHTFYGLSHILMSKNADIDVSKVLPKTFHR